MESGVLKVLFTYNSTGYFIYRGEVMGFEFRLLRAFAKENGLELEPMVVRDRESLFDRLDAGEGDVIAARLLAVEVGPEDAPAALITRPLYVTPPVLVQEIEGLEDPQLPEPVEEIIEAKEGEEIGAPEAEEVEEAQIAEKEIVSPLALRARLITRPAQLSGETVHVHEQSPYIRRLAELEDRISGDIRVVELDSEHTVEEAIAEVAMRRPKYTVAPKNLAELSEDQFANIEVLPVLGEPDKVVWGTRLNAPRLRDALNEWLANNPDKVREEYRTYFEDRESFRERNRSDFLTTYTGRLSQYDELLKEKADTIGWDWRLLAAQAFQESRFNAKAKSWAGARGLLQIMPRTAKEVGVKNLEDPEQNAAGAVRYLDKLDAYWARYLEGVDEDERLRFVLASYNAGFGHVQDARRLAEKNGDDPDRWEDVAYWLIKLSEKKYYNDPVVHYGYARGLEPVTYVSLILERYRHYLDFVPEVPGDGDGERIAAL